MNAKERKARISELLNQRDIDGLLKLVDTDRGARRILLSFAFDADELTRWRAIEAIGRAAALQAVSDIEKTRDTVRRLLWLMSDESGGLGWHSPELIGEILVNVPGLIDEFAELLPPYLREEPFERGTHFAIYRVASMDPKPFESATSQLRSSLTDSDPAIRAFAALALGAIDLKSYRNDIQKLKNDVAKVTVYDFRTGRLGENTVEQLAAKAVAKSDAAEHAA